MHQTIGEQLKHRRPERPDVGERVEIGQSSRRLLWRHERGVPAVALA
jgi:hypothetical protein